MTKDNLDAQLVREKILHVFGIYPKISPSMLQIGLNIKAAIWRPIVDDLIEEGLIRRSNVIAPTPSGRHQNYVVLKRVEVSAE